MGQINQPMIMLFVHIHVELLVFFRFIEGSSVINIEKIASWLLNESFSTLFFAGLCSK